MLTRLFGRQKEQPQVSQATPAVSAPPIDAAAFMDKSVKRQADYTQKINAINAELRIIQQQLQNPRITPFQRENLTQQARRKIQQRKTYESQVSHMGQVTQNFEQQAMVMERMQAAKEIYQMKKEHVSQMQEAQGSMGFEVDDIEELNEEFDELAYNQTEIDEVLSRPFATAETINDSDLNDELAALGDLDSLPDPVGIPGTSGQSYGVTDYATAGAGYGVAELDALRTNTSGSHQSAAPWLQPVYAEASTSAPTAPSAPRVQEGMRY
jgi:hypothetical protein